MKSIVCEQPGQFVSRVVDRPELKPDDAIVRVTSIGICGTDLHAYRGRQPFFTYPRVLGHELAGVIDDIADEDGEKYGLKLGDKVAVIPYLECGHCDPCRSGKTNCCVQLQVMGVHTDGGMREYISVPADHLIQTNELSFADAAIIECLSIGAHAVRRAGEISGKSVLVIGAGPIGLGVMKYAGLAGASVYAMDVNEERLAQAEAFVELDGTVVAGEGAEERLVALLGGQLPQVVWDATGNKASMENAFHFAGHGGALIYVGLVTDTITFDDPLFHAKELTLMASRNATREDFETVLVSMRDGHVDTKAFITHTVSFADDMGESFEYLLDPANKVIKAVVQLDGSVG